MSFDDVRFPDRIALGAEGGPTFATIITTSTGGHEQRQANWAEARRRYNVATGLKGRADVEALLAFYIARRGQLRGFRFKDWSDYQLPRQPIGITDGTLATFQIIKAYNSGSEQVARRVTRPVLDDDTVVRTIAGLSAPTATYIAADQTADFGTAQVSIAVRVYQLSAIAGRGIAARATL